MADFFEDLEMEDTKLANLNEDYPRVDNLAQPYYINKDGKVTKGNSNILMGVAVASGAGGILSSARDMIKYMQFHLNEGKNSQGRQIIPKDVYHVVRKTGMRIDDTRGYGLGLTLLYVPGQEPILQHSGSYPPYSSLMTIIPSLKVGIFTTTAGPGTETPVNAQSNLHNDFIQYFYEQEPKTEKFANLKLQSNPTPNSNSNSISSQTKVSAITKQNPSYPSSARWRMRAVQDLIGSFGHAVNGEMLISWRDESLQSLKLNFGKWGEADLDPLDIQSESDPEDFPHFKVNWISDIQMVISAISDTAVPPQDILEFQSPDILVWKFDPSFNLIFQRNLSLATIPEIPWGADTC